MSRDDIIRMAREAWDRDTDPWLTYEQAFLTRFAALVAAAERERNAQIADAHASIEGIAQAIAAEIRSIK
jgi:kynureninase